MSWLCGLYSDKKHKREWEQAKHKRSVLGVCRKVVLTVEGPLFQVVRLVHLWFSVVAFCPNPLCCTGSFVRRKLCDESTGLPPAVPCALLRNTKRPGAAFAQSMTHDHLPIPFGECRELLRRMRVWERRCEEENRPLLAEWIPPTEDQKSMSRALGEVRAWEQITAAQKARWVAACSRSFAWGRPRALRVQKVVPVMYSPGSYHSGTLIFFVASYTISTDEVPVVCVKRKVPNSFWAVEVAPTSCLSPHDSA